MVERVGRSRGQIAQKWLSDLRRLLWLAGSVEVLAT